MMKTLTCLALLLALGSGAQSAPICAEMGSFKTPGDSYHVLNWLPEIGTLSPEEYSCITLDGYDETGLSWHYNFSFAESRNWVKAGPYAGPTTVSQNLLPDIASMPTTWEWSFDEGIDVEASMTVSIQGDAVCLSHPTWILSIWLGSTGDIEVKELGGHTGEVIATTEISGIVFDVHEIIQPWGIHTVEYIFAAREPQNNFSGDLMDFVRWARQNEIRGVGECIWGALAGPVVFGGKNASITTHKYSLEQHLLQED